MNTNCNFVNKALSKGALLVGSRARAYAANVHDRLTDDVDWDLIIHPDLFNEITPLFGDLGFRMNSYGGFKITEGEHTIDIWPQTVEGFLKQAVDNGFFEPCVVDTKNKIVYTGRKNWKGGKKND